MGVGGDGGSGGLAGVDADINAALSGDNRGGTSSSTINAAMSLLPVIGPVLAAMDFGAQAGGTNEPGFGTGVGGPDTGVGVGGGPPQPPARKPVGVVPRTVTPAALPEPEPVKPIGLADIARRRIGRQQTILTRRGALSDTPTLKPTLLGQ